MILPIIAYGNPVLKKKAKAITADYKDLDLLIANMYQTMYNANGVGLAAPQIGLSIRLFVLDLSPFSEDEEFNKKDKELENYKRIFINPIKVKEEGVGWVFNEGCLSIPNIRGDVSRKETITIRYTTQDWEEKEETFSGIKARVIQHEYDHLEGILFTEKLSSLKKKLLKGKLNDIVKGNTEVDYKMKFAH